MQSILSGALDNRGRPQDNGNNSNNSGFNQVVNGRGYNLVNADVQNNE
ncbi:MAG: hypothetical protein PHZ04_03520 [Patescibacteria group bacterium]|nr:hypothetical protein [Patescibacteria group bacterium]MDD5554585.1 hypothetical protein [Patescibacteria group bacterium]